MAVRCGAELHRRAQQCAGMLACGRGILSPAAAAFAGCGRWPDDRSLDSFVGILPDASRQRARANLRLQSGRPRRVVLFDEHVHDYAAGAERDDLNLRQRLPQLTGHLAHYLLLESGQLRRVVAQRRIVCVYSEMRLHSGSQRRCLSRLRREAAAAAAAAPQLLQRTCSFQDAAPEAGRRTSVHSH
jgi:hypothetical protein